MTTSIPLCPTSFAAFLIFHYTSPILPVHSELHCNFPVQLFRKSGRLCAVEFWSFAGKHICTGCRVTILPFVQPKTFGKCFSICQFGQICQRNMHKDILLLWVKVLHCNASWNYLHFAHAPKWQAPKCHHEKEVNSKKATEQSKLDWNEQIHHESWTQNKWINKITQNS